MKTRDEKKYEAAVRRLNQDKRVSKKNNQLISAFDHALKLKGDSLNTRAHKTDLLKKWVVFFDKDFDKSTKKDVERAIERLIDNGNKPTTKYVMTSALRQFYKTMGKKYAPIVGAIKPKPPKTDPLNIKQLPTIEEVKRAADSCIKARDTALIKLTWEAGGRLSEMLGLTIDDVEEDGEGGAFLNIRKTKTDARRVFVYYFYGDLQRWMLKHPCGQDKKAPLFCKMNNGRQPITIGCAYWVVTSAFKRCGLTDKKINPHALRHASASYFAQSGLGLDDQDLKYKYGWSPSSSMLSRYLHPDADKIAEKVRGKAQQVTPPSPIECPRCHTINDGLSDRCGECLAAFKLNDHVKQQRALMGAVKLFQEFQAQHPEMVKNLTEAIEAV